MEKVRLRDLYLDLGWYADQASRLYNEKNTLLNIAAKSYLSNIPSDILEKIVENLSDISYNERKTEYIVEILTLQEAIYEEKIVEVSDFVDYIDFLIKFSTTFPQYINIVNLNRNFNKIAKFIENINGKDKDALIYDVLDQIFGSAEDILINVGVFDNVLYFEGKSSQTEEISNWIESNEYYSKYFKIIEAEKGNYLIIKIFNKNFSSMEMVLETKNIYFIFDSIEFIPSDVFIDNTNRIKYDTISIHLLT
jgi:hypothetical protein